MTKIFRTSMFAIIAHELCPGCLRRAADTPERDLIQTQIVMK